MPLERIQTHHPRVGLDAKLLIVQERADRTHIQGRNGAGFVGQDLRQQHLAAGRALIDGLEDTRDGVGLLGLDHQLAFAAHGRDPGQGFLVAAGEAFAHAAIADEGRAHGVVLDVELAGVLAVHAHVEAGRGLEGGGADDRAFRREHVGAGLGAAQHGHGFVGHDHVDGPGGLQEHRGAILELDHPEGAVFHLILGRVPDAHAVGGAALPANQVDPLYVIGTDGSMADGASATITLASGAAGTVSAEALRSDGSRISLATAIRLVAAPASGG